MISIPINHNQESGDQRSQDMIFMQRALDLSLLAAGRTSPNPLVGCVIVRDGGIVGEGYHERVGTPHAEIHALKAAGDKAKDADVYVTLEPCSHYGRTPPCADALIQSGVRRVCVALTDPNPLVNGRGLQNLKDAGIIVETGVLSKQAKAINETYLKAVNHKLPFVLYKCAMTLDGKIAVASGDSRWVSSEESIRYVHNLRNLYDVIMVGSRTVIQDNPSLTCRGIEGGRDPVKLIVDGMLCLPLDANVLKSGHGLCIIATGREADQEKLQRLNAMPGVEVWQYQEFRYVPLRQLLRDINARGWNSVLLEGGGTLAGIMMQENLIEKVEFIIAPKLAGSGPSPLAGLVLSRMADAINLKDLKIARIGRDYKISGYLE